MCLCLYRIERVFLCICVFLYLFLCAFYLCVRVPMRLYDPMFMFVYVSFCIFICVCRGDVYARTCMFVVYLCVCALGVRFGVCVCACMFVRVSELVFVTLIRIAYLSVPRQPLIPPYLFPSPHTLSISLSVYFISF